MFTISYFIKVYCLINYYGLLMFPQSIVIDILSFVWLTGIIKILRLGIKKPVHLDYLSLKRMLRELIYDV